MEKQIPDISIVIPLYNEESSFPILIDRLERLQKSVALFFEVVFVNDGSRDGTADLITDFCSKNKYSRGVMLSRNFGHQIAVSAGLSVAKGSEAIMVIDGDLQDPPELLQAFYERLKEGYDVVYGVRKKRKEGWFKRTAYHLFYRMISSISYISLPLDSGDFCMMSRKVVDVMNGMPEESRYLRGMRAWIGFKQLPFEYERAERVAGEAKYNFKMLFSLAYNGIFNFSEFPIKFITRLGSIGVTFSILFFIYNLYVRLTTDEVPSGFTSVILLIILFGSIQFMFLGILGEYILRVFFQVKKRPLFIIDKIV